MTRTCALLTCLALLLSASPAGADEPRPREGRVDLDLSQASLTEAVAQIERQAGRTILVDPDLRDADLRDADLGDANLKGRVTLRLRSVPWRQALSLVAERAKCEIHRRGKYLLLTRPKDRISIELYDANVRTALLLLARYADQSIVISPEIQGTITLRLHDVSAARAIRAVAKTAGDYVVVGEGGDPWRALSTRRARRSSAAQETPRPNSKPDSKPDSKPHSERVVEGAFRGLDRPQRGRPSVLLEREEEGAAIQERLRLARDPLVRAMQVRLLETLEPGTRIVIGARKAKGGWVATHLVAPSQARARRTQSAPAKSAPAKQAPTKQAPTRKATPAR